MIEYCVDYDDDGNIVQARAGQNLLPIGSHNFLVVDSHVQTTQNFYVEDGVLKEKPIPPSVHYKWNAKTKTWYSDASVVLEAISNKKAQIDAARLAANESPITYAGSLFDGDATSQSNALSWMVSISNGIPVPEGFTWRDFYNVDHPANAEFIVGLGTAMVTRGSLLYQQSWGFKAALDQLTSLSAVDTFTFEFDSQ